MRTAQRPYVTVVILLLGLCVLYPDEGWSQAADPIGTVLVATGTAEVQTQGSARWEPLRFRDPIFVNATVRTGSGSKVKVILRDDSVMTLAEHSALQFTEFLLTPQQRRLIVSLAFGTLMVLAERYGGAGSVMEARTPNAVVGVQGTTFIVKYIPPETTDVVSVEGLVGARNRALLALEFQPVLQNFRTRVVGTAPPTKAVEVSAATVQQLVQEVRVVEQSSQEVLTSAELQLLGMPGSGLVEGLPPAPPPSQSVIVHEQPVPEPPGTWQSGIIPADISIATSRARVQIIFPRR